MRASVLAFGIASAALLFVPPHPCLVWNASASAPIGLYVVSAPDNMVRGDLVLAMPPRAAAQLAATRGYLPAGVPLVKFIAGLAGDRVCSDGLHIRINTVERAIRLPWDGQGRALPVWRGCRILARDEVFLLNGNVLHSFDGRYFGSVSRHAILGKLRLLWRL